MGARVVWFKRDLRLDDHAPLAQAARLGPILALFVYEPEVVEAPEFHPRHGRFLHECLAELRQRMRLLGGDLILRKGTMPGVLEDLNRSVPIDSLHSHEETGTWATYQRDKRVARWARERGIPWIEVPQTGVVRRLASRDGWAQLWRERMDQPITPRPVSLSFWPIAETGDLGNPAEGSHQATRSQKGGERAAWETLRDFLERRSIGYRSELSSPLTAATSCSRLSAYLAFGALSMRRLVQATRQRVVSLGPSKKEDTSQRRWRGSLRAFESRLRWHCHFMQKLEDEPQIEFRNINRAFDGLREEAFQPDRFEAWKRGMTGFPMIDACMRSLNETGWLNFRMRAMLMSFAAYHLWLHWREPALHLARQFLDFEPGIHYPQCQMQSGVTGINTMRVYCPTKQALDQDPRGEFIRRWVPELAQVPLVYLDQPWLMPQTTQARAGCRMGVNYPQPIVDPKQAVEIAKETVARWREKPETLEVSRQVYLKHGSRNNPGRKKDWTRD